MANIYFISSFVAAILAIFYFVAHKIAVAVQNKFYKNKIIFNIMWEDPRLDKEALQFTKDDVILTISSAGCNALSFLLEEPKQIHLVDRNPCQNALVELKIAAIKQLEYEEFWMLFGEGKLPNFSTKYYPKLRPHLSLESQQFWDDKKFYFDGTGIKNSFYWRGTCGTVAWAISLYFKILPGVTKSFDKLQYSQTLEEQDRIYNTEIKHKVWNPILNAIIRSSICLSWTGIPIPQQQLLASTAGAHRNIGEWIKEQVQIVMTKLPLKDNYFWRLYLNGKYSKDCCPDYLKEENFVKLKSLVDRISVSTETITSWLQKNDSKITRFILLDHMDWMANHPNLLSEEWNEILAHSTEKTKILWRSASSNADFVLNTKVHYKGSDTQLSEILDCDEELANRLHPLDRVHTYTSLHIADFKY